MKDVQAMSAEQQVEAVSKKLMELNPGFDGKLGRDHGGNGSPEIANGVVTKLQLSTEKVSDISPLRSLVGLKILHTYGGGGGRLTDLSPLEGMPLTTLGLESHRNLSDISPLKGMPLTELSLWGCRNFRDLTPVRGMPLTSLTLGGTAVSDLSPLAEIKSLRNVFLIDCAAVTDLSPIQRIPLKNLNIAHTNAKDVSVLKGMPLKALSITFKPDRDTELLKSIKTLETINEKPVADFWKEVEEQQKGKKVDQ